jgi:hypothetical protein
MGMTEESGTTQDPQWEGIESLDGEGTERKPKKRGLRERKRKRKREEREVDEVREQENSSPIFCPFHFRPFLRFRLRQTETSRCLVRNSSNCEEHFIDHGQLRYILRRNTSRMEEYTMRP